MNPRRIEKNLKQVLHMNKDNPQYSLAGIKLEWLFPVFTKCTSLG